MGSQEEEQAEKERQEAADERRIWEQRREARIEELRRRGL